MTSCIVVNTNLKMGILRDQYISPK